MCPICKSRTALVIGLPKISTKAAQVIKQNYQIVKCSFCGSYFVNPQINLSLDEWRILYDQNYFPQMSNWYEKNRKRERIKRFDNIIKYSSNEIKNFLDIGCGEGFCLLEANNRGWNAYGVDITDNRISQAKKDDIEFFNSNLLECKFPDDFFDVVYMDSVLEHVINPYEYLSEIKRILKKGGILYLGIPNEDSFLNDVKKIVYRLLSKNISPKLKPFESPYHIVGFNNKSIRYALEKIQLKIKKLRNFACRVEFLKAKPFSREFFHSALLLPIYLLAIPLRREVYLETYVQKQ